jgi:hypothetical protein
LFSRILVVAEFDTTAARPQLNSPRVELGDHRAGQKIREAGATGDVSGF